MKKATTSKDTAIPLSEQILAAFESGASVFQIATNWGIGALSVEDYIRQAMKGGRRTP